jgi:hypothetical protein
MDARTLPISSAKDASNAPPEVFRSILFPHGAPSSPSRAPDFFSDLNLDQFVAAVTAGREEYELAPYFYALPGDVDVIEYRQEIMQDLEDAALHARIRAVAQNMREMRAYLGRVRKLYFREQQQAWFLDAVDTYCETIRSLAHDLAAIELRSRGFRGFRDYLSIYANSAPLNSLLSEGLNIVFDAR